MKKLILTSTCVAAIAAGAIAQGTVQWTVISPAQFTVVTNSTTSSYLSLGGSAALTGGSTGLTGTTANSYYYELLYSTTATTAPTSAAGLASWSSSGLEGDNSGSAGKVSVIGSTSDATVPFSSTVEIMMVGWSANIGSTWTAASAILEGNSIPTGTYFGESSLAAFTPNAAGVSPGAVPFGPAAGQIDSLNTPLYLVTSVPEPTTIALGVMGGLSLLALRRKKA